MKIIQTVLICGFFIIFSGSILFAPIVTIRAIFKVMLLLNDGETDDSIEIERTLLFQRPSEFYARHKPVLLIGRGIACVVFLGTISVIIQIVG